MTDEPLRVGVVVSRFNGTITDGLERGAVEALERLGAAVSVFDVAGALELPVVARALAEAGYDCVVALGAVIAGETDHYDHVATQSIAGLMQVATRTGVPVGIGVLTVRDARHAVERSRPGTGNKGAEAAEAAVMAARAVTAAGDRG